MAIFALERVPQVDGPIKIMKVVVNGFCPFDAFCTEIEQAGNLRGDLFGLFEG